MACNAVLLLAVIFFATGYAHSVRRDQEQAERETFCSMIETMKQLSTRYLESEEHYVDDWVAYIESQGMTEEQALEYLRTANSRTDRYAHIVDMDTGEARSTYLREDGDAVSAYQDFAKLEGARAELFLGIMQQMFRGERAVLGKYRVQETQITVVSVGGPVRLRMADGTDKTYLLLRVIPVESMKRNWIFPTEYASAEIGLITDRGDYVIQSASMRSENFLEFIRAYNFAEDYNGADEVIRQIAETQNGLLSLKNSSGADCYFYYTKLDGFAGVDLLGMIPESTIYRQHNNWPIVWLICGTVLLLACVDGGYILSMNHRLRKTAKLAEQASEAKTQFLSSMSHDIRTPLNAVLGMTELAQKRVDDPAYVTDCLNKISVSGAHLLTLINDILEISRVESGKTVLNPAPFPVEEMIDGLESIIRSQAASRGVTFEVDIGPLLQPWLVGDKLRLSQIYLNLLTNAVKYTNAGGTVRLTVREEPAEAGDRADLVCIVSDNGIGMSEEFQKTMYDSFSRAQDSRIDRIQGTGLGLAIVRRMVELMDGTILCASAPGEGTVFTVRISLPTAQEQPRMLPEGPEAANDLKGLRVLIAEDNDLNWEILSAMLTDQGLRCERAENGQLCVDKLESAPPDSYDLVLMDIQMPVLNGRDASRKLRQSAREDLHRIPIAAMTADAFAEDVQACLDAGMNAHLAKPVELEKVLMTIRRLCKR